MSLPEPHPRSGIIDCPADLTFEELIGAVEPTAWCLDGIQPEAEPATVADLLSRRQPRPLHWGCGLLASHCCRLEARTLEGRRYAAVGAPRRASGPDLRFLFIGGEDRFGHIETASFALVRKTRRYLVGRATYSDWLPLFRAAQHVALHHPRSTRRIAGDEKHLEVFIPLRGPTAAAVRSLHADLGLVWDDVTALPTEIRIGAEAPERSWVAVSAPYPRLSTLLADPSLSGHSEDEVDVESSFEILYPDAHGALVRLFGDPDGGDARFAVARDVVASDDFDVVLSSQPELTADLGPKGIDAAYPSQVTRRGTS